MRKFKGGDWVIYKSEDGLLFESYYSRSNGSWISENFAGKFKFKIVNSQLFQCKIIRDYRSIDSDTEKLIRRKSKSWDFNSELWIKSDDINKLLLTGAL